MDRRSAFSSLAMSAFTMGAAAATASVETKLENSRVKVIVGDSVFGRGLAANTAVPGGSLLLQVDPLIAVLNTKLVEERCSTCFAPSKTADKVIGKALLTCTRCGVLRYCSKV